MSAGRDVTPIVRSWLEQRGRGLADPYQGFDRFLELVDTTPQALRHRWVRGRFRPASAPAHAQRTSRRDHSVLSATRPIAAVAIVALGTGALYLAAAPSPSPTPIATPTPSPTGHVVVVAQDGTGDVTTIADGVALAVDGDIVLIRPGTYAGGLNVTTDISILGDGPRDEVVVELTDETPRRRWVGPGEISFGFVFQASDAHLADLTIRASNRELVGHETHARHEVVVVAGGSPVLERLAIDAADYAFDIATGLDQRVIVRDSSWTGDFGCDGGCNVTLEANAINGPMGLSSGAELRNNTITGFSINVPGTPLIEDNLITGATDIAISAGLDSRAVIRGNRIEESGVGILIREGGRPMVEGNVITENTVGILVTGTGSAPTIRGNEFCANQSDVSVGDGAEPVVESNEVCPS